MWLRIAASIFFASVLALGQSTAPAPFSNVPQLPPIVAASDPTALSIVAQALNAAGGLEALAAIQDFTATGQITYYWASQLVEGSVTLRGRGLDQFRLDANLPDGTRTWAVSRGTGKLKNADGSEKVIPGHNAIAMGELTFPAFYLALASASSSTTVSTPAVSGASGLQVRIQRHNAASSDPDGTIARLTTRDFSLDPATHLVSRAEIMTHPVETLTSSLPEDFYFAAYKNVSGVMVPFNITETINGQKIWTIQLTSITFNSGLTDAIFTL